MCFIIPIFKKMCGTKLFEKWRAMINVPEHQVYRTSNNNVVSNLKQKSKKLIYTMSI